MPTPVLLALALSLAPSPQGVSAPHEALVLVPFVPDRVRALSPVPCQLHVGLRGEAGARATLERLTASWDEYVVVDRPLATPLVADPDYTTAAATVELLPRALTELQRDRRAYADESAPPIAPAELPERLAEHEDRVARLRERQAAGGPAPFAQPRFLLHLDQVFEPDAAPGARRALRLAVRWRDGRGVSREDAVDVPLTWLGPSAPLPSTLPPSTTAHAGDLHVHSCHGEALGACPPGGDCSAEAVQLSGSFTLAELKTQFQALGMDWFASTDHSYCIDTPAERRAIAAEAAALTDAAFVCLPDLELSSDEVGPQVGTDLGDLTCFGATRANHMGAHGAGPAFDGGSSGLFGFCDGFDDVLSPFDENVAAIRARGGFPLINHPTATFFGWNSLEATYGIESDGLHGVEIWNGELQTGQGGDVGAWVDWLLAGRILYGYSGSDTHDHAFAFGATHALLEGAPLTPRNLHAALRAGRAFVSNGPALVLELGLGGQTLAMGGVHTVPTTLPPTPIVLRAHASFGAGAELGRVRLFRGRVGDAEETALVTTAPFSGERVVECPETLLAGVQTYYRAYAESEDGTLAAYSNPIFLIPGGDGTFAWCLAQRTSAGCLPAIGWTGTPSASSGAAFTIEATGVAPNAFGLLVYGTGAQAVPFQGGTLCVAPPVRRTPAQVSSPGTACDARLAFDFNAWIAAGVDPALTPGTSIYAQFYYRDPPSAEGSGLTDATCFTIEP